MIDDANQPQHDQNGNDDKQQPPEPRRQVQHGRDGLHIANDIVRRIIGRFHRTVRRDGAGTSRCFHRLKKHKQSPFRKQKTAGQ